MRFLNSLGAGARWLLKAATRIAGIQSHGVDPNGADNLYKPRPPEYRP